MDKQVVSDRMAGCLIGTAIGDALGAPAEGLSPYVTAIKYQHIDGFYSSKGREAGQYTTVTCRALATAAAIAKTGSLDRDVLVKAHAEFRKRNPHWAVGAGEEKAFAGATPEECSSATLDAEFLPRAIPIGLMFSSSGEGVDKPMSDACKTATLLTSSLRTASLCSFVVARTIKEVIRNGQTLSRPSEAYDSSSSLLARLAGFCQSQESKWGGDENHDSLWKRLLSTRRYLQAENGVEAFVGTHGNGNSCLEAVPFALFCFLKEPDDFSAIRWAASMGGAAPLNAALVGSFVGAYIGASGIPEKYRSVEHMAQVATLGEKMAAACFKETTA